MDHVILKELTRACEGERLKDLREQAGEKKMCIKISLEKEWKLILLNINPLTTRIFLGIYQYFLCNSLSDDLGATAAGKQRRPDQTIQPSLYNLK